MSQETTQEGIGASGDLFDAMGTEGEQFKPKKEEKQQPQKSGSASPARSAAKPKVYPEGTLVVHQGDHKTLDKELTEKEVYELFNDDHPDVSMDRYELLEDKEKNRFWFKAKGFKKGGRPERDGRPITVLTAPPELASPTASPGTSENASESPAVSRVLTRGGVYEVRRTRLGTFMAKVPDANLRARAGFYSQIPKPPARMLLFIVEAFRDRPNHEAVVEVFYDRRDGSFKSYWPPQRDATAGSVEYDPLPETDDVFRYLNIHSHNRMPAFFSATDDEFETTTGLFGVIGRAEDDKPEALFRASCGGLFLPLDISDLFDDADLARRIVREPRKAPAPPLDYPIAEANIREVRP